MDNHISSEFHTLINTFDPKTKDICLHFKIQKVILHLKSRQVFIHYETSVPIDPLAIVMVENELTSKLTDIVSVRLVLSTNSKNFDLSLKFDSYWSAVALCLARDIPSSNGLTEYCKTILIDEVLHIRVSHPLSATLFNKDSTVEYIKQRLFELSGVKISVKINIIDKHEDNFDESYLDEKLKEDLKLYNQVINSKNKDSKNSKTKRGIEEAVVLFGKNFKETQVSIKNVNYDMGIIAVQGVVFGKDIRNIKDNRALLSIDLTDYESSVTCKLFLDKTKASEISEKVTIGSSVKIRGECRYDKFYKDTIITILDLVLVSRTVRYDNAENKRVELHVHTNMSAMDAVSSADALFCRAKEWGHYALAITDHGVVQAFPDVYAASKKYGVKAIYGLEAYMIDDCKEIVMRSNDRLINDQCYVVLDIETTGLNAKSDKIIEVAAVRILNEAVTESFHSLINPGVHIPSEITKLTGITNDMVEGAPDIKTVMIQLFNFIRDDCLIIHNAPFDLGFLYEYYSPLGLELKNPVIDTLILSRELLKDLKKHNLLALTEFFRISLDNHHRALDDVKATAMVFLNLKNMLQSKGIHKLNDINATFQYVTNLNTLENNHVVILVKNQSGLRNLYNLVSLSHMEYFYRKPRIPKSIFMKNREGLIIGSGCNSGELFKALIIGRDMNELKEIASFYDYLEVQPIVNNMNLLTEKKIKDVSELQEFIKIIVNLGVSLNKPVIAAGDVHYLDPSDKIFRDVLLTAQGINDQDSFNGFYYKTTGEMINDFEFIGKEKAYEIVVQAPLNIAKSIETIKPIPDGFYPPKIQYANKEIEKMVYENTTDLYGAQLPEIVKKRLEKELDSILGNDFAVLYYVAHRLVKKSIEDGYLVGSRGSVGSSFVAKMTGITEVNPLPPHYLCPKCKLSDFVVDVSKYSTGIDLPDKLCPICDTKLNKEGFDIPFEVFMGFDGDKVPDIDLNFSGQYQPLAHRYAEEIFGKGRIFRAGTIGTIAEKTAFGFVKKYTEDKNISLSNTEIKRLVQGCTGVKRTTGQHPGGVIVVPHTTDIYNFTPVQYPADDRSSNVITTHFDYHSISNRLIKLDILGHDDPTVIRMLEELTNFKAVNIPIDDKKTMSIFSSTDALGISSENLGCSVGTLGIPEFGTRFVRQMLLDTKPTTFSELVRISGLSHGTDVWLNNAQELVKSKTAQLSEVISTRDDIMVYLIYKGLSPDVAFDIMETVRKGKTIPLNLENEMNKNNVPAWFVESCKKITYLFPKAHAVAYVLMAFRIAYFKVYYPDAFYATYFTVKADDFDESIIMSGRFEVLKKIKELESKGNELSNKERNLLVVLEVAHEMYLRNINMLSVDLQRSEATKFQITPKGLLPPFNAYSGVGISAAKSIVEARMVKPFMSIEDLTRRAKISKTVIETLKKSGCLLKLTEHNQISIS